MMMYILNRSISVTSVLTATYLPATRKNYPQNGELPIGQQVNKILRKNTAISLLSLGLASVFVFTIPLKKCPVHKKKSVKTGPLKVRIVCKMLPAETFEMRKAFLTLSLQKPRHKVEAF